MNAAACRTGAAVLAGILLLAPPLAAQERSPTGRHRPPPPAPEDPVRPATGPGAGRWTISFGAGVVDGGDLVRVATADGLPVRWDPDYGGGFRSARFLAEIAPGPGLSLGVGRRLGRRLGLRIEAGWSRHDIRAEADLGESGAVYRFDRWSLAGAVLDLEVRLLDGPAHPYLALGAGALHMAPDAADLAQTAAQARLAVGYRFPLDRALAVRLEAWAARSGFTAEGWVPVTLNAEQPPVTVAGEDHVPLVGLLLVMQLTLDP